MKKISILFILPDLETGGAERIVITIAIQIIVSIFMAVFAVGNLENTILNGSDAITAVHWLLNGTTMLNVVMGIGFYYGTLIIMKKRLNLE